MQRDLPRENPKSQTTRNRQKKPLTETLSSPSPKNKTPVTLPTQRPQKPPGFIKWIPSSRRRPPQKGPSPSRSTRGVRPPRRLTIMYRDSDSRIIREILGRAWSRVTEKLQLPDNIWGGHKGVQGGGAGFSKARSKPPGPSGTGLVSAAPRLNTEIHKSEYVTPCPPLWG